MGELMRLRGMDVIEQEGVYPIKISPEAGTTKRRMDGAVNEHLEGFIAFWKPMAEDPVRS